MDTGEGMTLAEARDGLAVVVTRTIGDEITNQAMRFGIGEGSKIHVQKNIKGGPVIISKNQLEIAIGRQLAQLIEVALV